MDDEWQTDAETWRHLVAVSYPALNAGDTPTAEAGLFLEKSRRYFALHQRINGGERLPESLLAEGDELSGWLGHRPETEGQ